AGDAAKRVAIEDDALAIRVHDAARANGQGVAVRIAEALQTRTLIDDVSGAVFGSELEDKGIEDIHAAAGTDQVHRPGHAPIDLDIGRAHDFQHADGSRHGREADARTRDRSTALAMRRDGSLELEDFAAGEGHRADVRA